MTGSRRERSRKEGTFLEEVKSTLQEFRSELAAIKMELVKLTQPTVEAAFPLHVAGGSWGHWNLLAAWETLADFKLSDDDRHHLDIGVSQLNGNADAFSPCGLSATDVPLSRTKLLKMRMHKNTFDKPGELKHLSAITSCGDLRMMPSVPWKEIYDRSVIPAANDDGANDHSPVLTIDELVTMPSMPIFDENCFIERAAEVIMNVDNPHTVSHNVHHESDDDTHLVWTPPSTGKQRCAICGKRADGAVCSHECRRQSHVKFNTKCKQCGKPCQKIFNFEYCSWVCHADDALVPTCGLCGLRLEDCNNSGFDPPMCFDCVDEFYNADL